MRTNEILGLYEKALRDADSPLVVTAERWQQTRNQAEAVLSECVRVSGGTVEGQSDSYASTRQLGFERAHQQVLVADSIRAGTLLWRAAVPVLREILTSGGSAGHGLLPDVLEALHEAIASRLYIGSMAYEHAMLAGAASVGGFRRLPGHCKSRAASRPENITAREWEVLECVSRALSNRAIAKELALSEPTVKTHLRKVFRKLGATSRIDAIQKAGLAGQSP